MKFMIVFVYFALLIERISSHFRLKRQIAGGENAFIENFPYQVSIRHKGKHYCGGSIISDRHILTGAHCLSPDPTRNFIPSRDDLTIHTGTSSSAETGHSHRIARISIHPGWTGSRYQHDNDLAIILLEDRIIFDGKQQKIALPTQDVISGVVGTLTGWGPTVPIQGSPNSIQLQMLKMRLLTYSDCQQYLREKLQNNQFCAFSFPGCGSCPGDSGGPLVLNNEIIGIVSWISRGKCASGIPEVYTNIYFHKEFIQSVMDT